MAFHMRSFSCFVPKFSNLWSKSCTARIQFIRCESLKADKLVYSEYGDAAKVVRQEKRVFAGSWTLSGDLSDTESKYMVIIDNCRDTEGILVKMLVAPVNPADINTIQGVYPVKPKLPSIPGNEGVAEVISVGSAVKNLKKGDRVFPAASAWGTWRTHAICDAKEMCKVPDTVGTIEAATVSVNPCTAFRMLRDFVSLSTGDVVLQNGANSAAGQNVIQICKVWGLKTVNVVRNRDDIDDLKEMLQCLGGTYVLTEEEIRTTELFKNKTIPKPKLMLNCVGGKNALDCLRQLDKGGVMVTYGGMSREPVTVPTSALIFKDVKIKGFWMTRWHKEKAGTPDHADMMQEIWRMMENGFLKAPQHKLVPFTNYKEALQNTMNPKGFSGHKYILNFQC